VIKFTIARDVDHFMDVSDRIPFVLVEDHAGISEALGFALCAQLPLRLVAHCDRVQKAIAVCRETKPTLVIFDWRMPEGEGGELPRTLAASLPETRWLLYTAFPSAWVVRNAVEAGAHACVSKGASQAELVKACRELLAGGSYFCPESTKSLRAVMANRSRDAGLNSTEQKILHYVAKGMEPKDISMSAGVAVGTVRNYLVQIRQKIGVASMVDLAKYAVEHGLAPPR
jgi:DNA-binding NarL/FixJ family response regulator